MSVDTPETVPDATPIPVPAPEAPVEDPADEYVPDKGLHGNADY